MEADTSAHPLRNEHLSVELWRLEELTKAGCPEGLAFLLARREDIDLHLAVDLLKRGCSPELVKEILL